MLLELKQIILQPGNQLLLKDITWPMFETLLTELGESRASRLSYSKGTLEIMVPLPEHEIGKVSYIFPNFRNTHLYKNQIQL